MPENLIEISRIPPSFSLIFSSPKCLKSSFIQSTPVSCLNPLPSSISVIIALETISRGANSIIPAAYFSMKRSPLLFSRYPPSPLAPSVIKIPDGKIPVGWNCTNSISFSAIPAR